MRAGPTVVAASTDAATATESKASPMVTATPPAPPEPPPPSELAGAEFRRRYGLGNALTTLVTDHGDGYAGLYGTRNVRAVLNGIFYRGGANNAFDHGPKRANKNPLTVEGLDNLCKEGFGTAIYLYPTNFDSVPHAATCQTVDGREGTLHYEQLTTQHFHKDDLRKIFGWITDRLEHPELGPVFAHCWNGWHASGYLAAVTLRQFCGFTGAQALRYWTLTAKGASNADHADTKARIDKFKPFPEFSLTPEQKAALCPDPKTLKFAAPEAAPAASTTAP